MANIIILGYTVQGKRVRNITSTIRLALGLCLHSSKIKQIVLVWVPPDPMSTSTSSSSFCGRRPMNHPQVYEKVRWRIDGREYTEYHKSALWAARAQSYWES